jgi:hypothetical protein
MIFTGEDRRIRSKTCPIITLSATNLLFHLVVLFTSMIGQCGEDDDVTDRLALWRLSIPQFL